MKPVPGTPKDHGALGDSIDCINKAQCEVNRLKLETLSTARVRGWIERFMEHAAGWLHNHEIPRAQKLAVCPSLGALEQGG